VRCFYDVSRNLTVDEESVLTFISVRTSVYTSNNEATMVSDTFIDYIVKLD
jgi:hypothetical protein